MSSIVDIVNQALDECKARASVTSIFPSDGSLAANVASRHFWPRIDALARSANWNSHRFQQTLGLLKAAQGTPENPSGSTLPLPPMPWVYEYAVPTAPLFLRARYIVPLAPNGLTSTVPLTTAGSALAVPSIWSGRVPYLVTSDVDANQNQIRVILTNLSQAQLVYTCRISDPNLWDAQFVDAAVGVLASYLALPVTGDKQIAAGAISRAKECVLAARISDGDENPVRSGHIPDWLTARGAGSWSARDSFPTTNGWESLTFGDGTVL